MTSVRVATRETFASLGTRNYRLYFTAQVVSLTGNWMQQIAQAWLVLQLSGSGSLLGVTVALQFLPTLLIGPWAGVIADRRDKRRMLAVTQSLAGALAVSLGALVATGAVQLWMVMAFALVFGCVLAFDNPARQSFVLEMTGPEQVLNAVTLNTILINVARALGPAAAGFLIAGAGIALCFLLNGLTYVAMLLALFLMRPDELHRGAPTPRGPGQLREGLSYVWHEPVLRIPLLVMVAVGCLAFEFAVSLPLLARFTFGGDATTLAWLSGAMGVGAIVGGLATARRSPPTAATLPHVSLFFGAAILVTAAAPTLPLAIVSLLATGVGSILFLSTANAWLQITSAPAMRGRVMALWTVAFMGTTPIGGPIVGAVGESVGPRWALALGGLTTIVAGLVGAWALRRAAGRAEPAIMYVA